MNTEHIRLMMLRKQCDQCKNIYSADSMSAITVTIGGRPICLCGDVCLKEFVEEYIKRQRDLYGQSYATKPLSLPIDC